MNIINKEGHLYLYESFWRHDTYKNDRDSFGKLFPFPYAEKQWSGQEQFLTKLISTENSLSIVRNSSNKTNKRYTDCLICKKKNINSGVYKISDFIWEDGLIHYIKYHNIKPSENFIEVIYTYKPPIVLNNRSEKRLLKFKSDLYVVHDMRYVKINRNQIMIMDALLKHGGYTKKYIDSKNKKIYRYSEHSGLLDFNKHGLEKLIISGKTDRVDRGDEEIYLPKNIPDAFEYEYIFHTHPPTPKPGGRAELGILYEFPSISDIFHFIDHFNSGLTQGSLVLAAEGMYNIRKLIFDRKKIKINEDEMFEELQELYPEIQSDAIIKYGSEFKTKYFYEKIAQNMNYINKLNKSLNKYEIQIDYYPRTFEHGKWIITDLFLPIYITELKR